MEIASQIYRKIKWQVEKFSERCEVYGVVFIYGPYSSFSGLVFLYWKDLIYALGKCSIKQIWNVRSLKSLTTSLIKQTLTVNPSNSKLI